MRKGLKTKKNDENDAKTSRIECIEAYLPHNIPIHFPSNNVRLSSPVQKVLEKLGETYMEKITFCAYKLLNTLQIIIFRLYTWWNWLKISRSATITFFPKINHQPFSAGPFSKTAKQEKTEIWYTYILSINVTKLKYF